MAYRPHVRDLVLSEQLKSFFERLSARPLPSDVLDMVDQLEAGNEPAKARVLVEAPG